MVEELMGHEENCEYHRIKGMHDAYVDLLTFLDYSLSEDKPSYVTDSPGDPGNPGEPGISDLEEAADNHIKSIDDGNDEWSLVDVKDAFIAGAKWQAKQLLKGSPLPDDTVLFQKGVEEGKRLMMEEAVEGEIGYWNQRGLSIRLDKSLERLGYDMDTKVKIVIVKQDDRPRD
jgi:hypothetical protein